MEILIPYIVLGTILSIVIGNVANSKGKDFWGYFLLSLFFSPLIGILILIASASNGGSKTTIDKPGLPEKWSILKDIDPEIRSASERARNLSYQHELVLAEKYLTLDDKKYLEDLLKSVMEDDNIASSEKSKSNTPRDGATHFKNYLGSDLYRHGEKFLFEDLEFDSVKEAEKYIEVEISRKRAAV